MNFSFLKKAFSGLKENISNISNVFNFFTISKLVLALLFFIVLTSFLASSVFAVSQELKITSSDKFDNVNLTFTVESSLTTTENLDIKFFSPFEAKIVAPSVISPGQKVSVKVNLIVPSIESSDSKETKDTKNQIINLLANAKEISATFEARAGIFFATKEVLIETGSMDIKNNNSNNFAENIFGNFSNELSGGISAFFSVGSFFSEVSKLSWQDTLILIVLVLVAAILMIAFISRMTKLRNQSSISSDSAFGNVKTSSQYSQDFLEKNKIWRKK
jgi:hypothetical protein